MTHNPFNTDRFAKSWLKHFKDSMPSKRFDYINGVNFYKDKHLPLYINVGKNLTKGFYYTINSDKVVNSNNVFLIRDIPTYFNVPELKGVKGLKAIKARQYNGYLTYLEKYSNLEDFIIDKYNSSGRNVLRRRLKGLETSFDIKHEVFYGAIEQDTYDVIIEEFHRLLIKRFSEKKTEYHILKKWDYFKEIIYSMVLNKEAVLYVIYANENPIGIYLSICFNNVVSGAIPVFDTDYAKFGLGNILTLKQIEWCIENKMEIFDSSKGDYGEKERISDLKYFFEYHILYNPRSIASSVLAFGISSFFKLKQFLREKEIHSFYHNLKFKLSLGKESKNPNQIKYEFTESAADTFQNENVDLIDIQGEDYLFLKKMVYNFLYKSREHVKDVKIYKESEFRNTYHIVGKNKMLKITEVTT
ncbi:GNAT family N-acetyltransferase [uncultured Allomuricauda sp.]|uniref:GNAT family N-acetyltransferase n=1 Tax=Flagellimonas sp. W118 TaxID=3410791 RepID=UPI00261A3294|nr:GNAT family N-acetyltransferase [uncultured Allomuricauda sp.]